jgi:hypothetical protein
MRILEISDRHLDTLIQTAEQEVKHAISGVEQLSAFQRQCGGKSEPFDYLIKISKERIEYAESVLGALLLAETKDTK